MNINRFLSIKAVSQLPKYLYCFARCFIVFRNPFLVISHYISKVSPVNKKIMLRNGFVINLSDQPHDIVTVFIVFAREDYGKVMLDSTIVDVGANIGSFSLLAASMGAKKVYSYEPNSQAYAVLLRNISDNKLEDVIIPRRLAVTDKDNETIGIPLDPSPYNEISLNNIENTEDDIEEVNTICLESILSSNSIDALDLLKIDCEGMEYDIFFNSKDSVFSKINEIKMEYHEGPLSDLISYIESHGFYLEHYDKAGQCLWFDKSK